MDSQTKLVITGTFLLYVNGLVDEFDDVDILVVNADKSFRSDLYSNDYRWDIKDYDGYKSVKVTIDEITYNFIEDDSYQEFTNGFVDCNGEVEFDTLSHALKAKAKLDRPKDKPHFEKIKERINQQ